MSEIEFYQFPGGYGLGSFSPFCLKLQAYLRFMEIPYRLINSRDTSKAPTKKMPYIVDNGQAIGDSGMIIDHLKTRTQRDPDTWLSAEQRAVSTALIHMLEDHFAWTMVYSRWLDPANDETLRRVFFGRLAAPLKWLVVPMLKKRAGKSLWAQGLGRHPRDEIYRQGIEDLEAFATCLGDKPFLMGDRPATVDTVAYGFLANLLRAPFASPLFDAARSHANITDYVDRLEKKWFPEVEERANRKA
ncbi:Glutathione S-transferase family protein [Sulfidibacter corallicola]|uniref:Glutathione S-transferase family protein n=1 Tax=Sulfidibacter corallicola TaxID=2818388 RepID=A0A8A4TPX0_SULCO|nr:glutathione S-transferase family protein [Sulfidibacter corallicola]QTD51028.1 glutathione S-transferase family protein [Sulfidibacter corallicola]